MSQLRNLLTNKVIAHKVGGGRNLSRFRRSRKGVAAQGRKLRSEITEQRALAASQYVPKDQPKPGMLRRLATAFRRLANGS